jgi:hypothetical protein
MREELIRKGDSITAFLVVAHDVLYKVIKPTPQATKISSDEYLQSSVQLTTTSDIIPA